MYRLDANNKCALLDLMMVCDNESVETWSIYFRHVISVHMKIDLEEDPIISDQDKSISSAIL